MINPIILALAGAANLIVAGSAAAAVYDWTLAGTDTGSGVLITGAPDSGGVDIVGFTGTIDGNVIEGLQGGNPGSPGTSPTGAFNYDNILFPNDFQSLDGSGILFRIAGEEGNIWATQDGYGYANAACGNCLTLQDSKETFAIKPALSAASTDMPEPLAITLLGSGLAALAAFRRRKKGLGSPPGPDR